MVIEKVIRVKVTTGTGSYVGPNGLNSKVENLLARAQEFLLNNKDFSEKIEVTIEAKE